MTQLFPPRKTNHISNCSNRTCIKVLMRLFLLVQILVSFYLLFNNCFVSQYLIWASCIIIDVICSIIFGKKSTKYRKIFPLVKHALFLQILASRKILKRETCELKTMMRRWWREKRRWGSESGIEKGEWQKGEEIEVCRYERYVFD